MITVSPVVALPGPPCQLAESPQWLAGEVALQHVDILGHTILRRSLDGGDAVAPLRTGGDVGFALALEGGGVLAGVERDLLRFPFFTGGAPERIADVRGEPGVNRFNDACCDPAGRVLAGTLSRSRAPGTAALYRLEPSGALTWLLPATISNGLDWNADGTVLYYVDSTTQQVDAIGYDVDTGALGARRAFVHIAPEDGLPDGLAVDAAGGVWLALFGGGAVCRYTPGGALDAEITLPVTNPTSLAFGGTDLKTLFVTSARHLLSAEQLAREPLAGSVLALRPGVSGRPPRLPGHGLR
jgi:sugar lactone lactonase YvrE